MLNETNMWYVSIKTRDVDWSKISRLMPENIVNRYDEPIELAQKQVISKSL